MTCPTEAGRDLDALIADKVMGWTVESSAYESAGIDGRALGTYKGVTVNGGHTPWSPSTDFAAAWQVVERFPRFVVSKFPGYTRCYVWREWEQDDLGSVTASSTVCVEDAETAPLAICRAALAAVSRSSAESDAASPAGQA